MADWCGLLNCPARKTNMPNFLGFLGDAITSKASFFCRFVGLLACSLVHSFQNPIYQFLASSTLKNQIRKAKKKSAVMNSLRPNRTDQGLGFSGFEDHNHNTIFGEKQHHIVVNHIFFLSQFMLCWEPELVSPHNKCCFNF